MEIRLTDTPSRELLLLADESEASIADYLPRSHCYAAFSDGQIVGQYLLLHTRPFTAEVVSIAVAPAHQRRGIATALLQQPPVTPRTKKSGPGQAGTGPHNYYSTMTKNFFC